jgi:5-methylcytosine-specific restriction endonuclease McrA
MNKTSNDYYQKCMFPKPQKVKKRKPRVSEETYNYVFNACKGRCVLCGTSQYLHLHHISGRGRYLTDEPTNCVMLCSTCHEVKVHGNLKKYRPILLDSVKEIYKC